MATTASLTIDDFERLPAEQAKNHELVDGELIEVSGNTPYHNSLRDYLVEILRPFARERRLGKVISEQEYDFAGNAHGPDVTFLSQQKESLLDVSRRVQRFVPDLAIEIVSQNDEFNALLRKKDRYRQCGVSEVWIVSPESREVFVFSDRGNRILGEADALASDQLPGFFVRVGELLDRAQD